LVAINSQQPPKARKVCAAIFEQDRDPRWWWNGELIELCLVVRSMYAEVLRSPKRSHAHKPLMLCAQARRRGEPR